MAEEVLAPMVGKVIRIEVQVGDKVQEDEEIMIVESMKLETGIHATCDGTIEAIKVAVGDSVEEDDVLVVIG